MGLAGEDAAHDGQRGVAPERGHAEECLPQRGTERVLIGGAGERAPHVLLGRHVAGGAEHHAVLGDVVARVEGRSRAERVGRAGLGGVVVLGLGQAEVGDLAGASLAAVVLGQDHVGRLEVAVQQALVVRRGQAAPGVDERREDLGPAPRTATQPLAQRRPSHQLHGEHHLLLRVVLDVVHGDDVGVAEPGHRPRLADQASAGGGIDAGGAQHLERHLALELGVIGAQDPAHAPAAELVDGQVPAEVLGAELERRRGGGPGRRGLELAGVDAGIGTKAGRRHGARIPG